MLEVGALTTMTPRAVAAGTSTLSSPTPARATTFSRGAAASASASIWVALRTMHRVGVGERRQQRGAVGAVDVAHVEVGGQHLERGRGELFGDEDDGTALGLGHSCSSWDVDARRSPARRGCHRSYGRGRAGAGRAALRQSRPRM